MPGFKILNFTVQRAEPGRCSRRNFSGPGKPQMMLSSPGSALQTLCIYNFVLPTLKNPEPGILALILALVSISY